LADNRVMQGITVNKKVELSNMIIKFNIKPSKTRTAVAIKLIFIFVLISMTGIAHEWAPVGATWHYTERFSFWSPKEIDYIKIESVKDTLIEGITCKKLTKRHNIGCTDRPDVEFMYSQDDKVYFYDSGFNTFQILYDFGANTGDSWIIRVKDYLDPDDTDSLVVTVDSTDFKVINGVELKRLFVTYLFLNETNPNYSYNATIIESVGDLWYMFNYYPEWAFGCDANFSQGLRCYEDPVIGLYETGIADSCTYVQFWTGIEEGSKSPVEIFPNPTSEFIAVKGGPGICSRYRILNITGKEILSGTVVNNQIGVQNLAKGLYIIELYSTKNIILSRQKFLKN
jgi:hypothetical protein